MARDDETARYEEAAYSTLEQLDWCVEYLRRLRKNEISRQLARNTTAIRRRIDEPRRQKVARYRRAR